MDRILVGDRARVSALIHRLELFGEWPPSTERRDKGSDSNPHPKAKAPTKKPRQKTQQNPLMREAGRDVDRLQFQLRLVVDYCNGATQAELAREYGLHVQTVRARLREAGVQVASSRAALSAKNIEEMRGLHSRGQSARQLARRYGVAHTTVLRAIKPNG